MNGKELMLTMLVVGVGFSVPTAAQGARPVHLTLESSGLGAGTSVEVEAGARYVIDRPSDVAGAPRSAGAFVQESDQKLVGRAGGSGSESRTVQATAQPLSADFVFDPRPAGPGESARIEFPVKYMIRGRATDGTLRTLVQETTFVLKDRDPSRDLTRCLRVQGFPGENVRVGLAECGTPWATP